MKSAPLYMRVKDALLQEIPAGRFQPGSKLPTEDELMRMHQVSRATVRKALDLLQHEGLIERYARRGTFVASKPATTAWTASSLDDVLRLGAETVPAWFEWKRARSAVVADRLDLPSNHDLYRLRSIRSHQGVPIYFLEAYVASGIGRRLLRDDLKQRMLFDVIEQKLGIPIPKGIEEVSAEIADRRMAQRLQVAPGAPLLVLEVIYFGVDGRPVEYAKAWYRGDKFRRRHALSRDWITKRSSSTAVGARLDVSLV
jgi:GntR family transcriptional regulator